MDTQQAIKEPEELEAMSTEEFLAWLLTSCKIDEDEFAPIRRDVQDYMLSTLVHTCFDIEAVEARHPNLTQWLYATQLR